MKTYEKTLLAFIGLLILSTASAMAWPWIWPAAKKWQPEVWSAIGSWVQAVGSIVALYVAIRIADRGERRAEEEALVSAAAFALGASNVLVLGREATEKQNIQLLRNAAAALREMLEIGRSVPLHNLDRETMSAVISLRGLLADVTQRFDDVKLDDNWPYWSNFFVSYIREVAGVFEKGGARMNEWVARTASR